VPERKVPTNWEEDEDSWEVEEREEKKVPVVQERVYEDKYSPNCRIGFSTWAGS